VGRNSRRAGQAAAIHHALTYEPLFAHGTGNHLEGTELVPELSQLAAIKYVQCDGHRKRRPRIASNRPT
jgi:hypothetical protein